jgi:CDP-6-deoxy-D-xylo-4-hexulose-3-dehydrase
MDSNYYPWIQNGYRLKFVDINFDNFNVDLDKLESSIDNNCVGICVPHILGGDAGIEKILALAELHNLWVIEDTCESLG